jgi:integrase
VPDEAHAAPSLAVVAKPKPVSLARDLATIAGRMAAYRQALFERELSPRTVRQYCGEAHNAEWWCEQQGYTLRNVPALVLAQYVERRPKTWSSRSLTRKALRHYWDIFGRRNPPMWVLRLPKKPRMVCKALSDEDAARLARLARERGDNKGLATLVAMYQGLRREEISAIRWSDLTDDGWINVFGKGSLPATLPLHPVVAAAFEHLERLNEGWVFPSPIREGQHVHPATVWDWIHRLAAEAGLEGVGPHQLRHTCLATANDRTGDLRAVQDFARHARPETTAGYTRSTEARLRSVVESLTYEEAPREA